VFKGRIQCTDSRGLQREFFEGIAWSLFSALAGSSGERNVTVRRLSVCLSHFFSRGVFFPILRGCAVHAQRDSPRNSTRRGQRTFSFEYYDDGNTSIVLTASLLVREGCVVEAVSGTGEF